MCSASDEEPVAARGREVSLGPRSARVELRQEVDRPGEEHTEATVWEGFIENLHRQISQPQVQISDRRTDIYMTHIKQQKKRINLSDFESMKSNHSLPTFP